MSSGGPGCLVWTLVGVVALAFSLLIIALAGTAGWTAGQRIARANAAATQDAEIDEQCARIPADIAAGNTALLSARIEYLVTQTPAVPCVLQFIPTATALYLTALPTATPMPSATVAASSTPAPSETAPAATQSVADTGGFDLDALLEEAQVSISLAQWTDAIETLDAISAIDEDFKAALVEGLLFEALTKEARRLYISGEELAEAIALTDRAEELDDIGELNFERLVAELYLDAKRNIGLNYGETIRLLWEVYGYSPNYRGGEVIDLLFNQQVAYADALVAGGDFCPAVPPYNGALSLRSNATISAKRDDADTRCLELTLTPGTEVTPGVAPVGVEITPGG